MVVTKDVVVIEEIAVVRFAVSKDNVTLRELNDWEGSDESSADEIAVLDQFPLVVIETMESSVLGDEELAISIDGMLDPELGAGLGTLERGL